ncbi:VOC family protein [Polaromonas sp.]|uniref:VOC family protein n=1 Tax=Polaromonas sp. TaxID=1869339 RepID=UPI003BAD853F
MSPSNLGYVVLGVNDLARWEAFAVDAIGMQTSYSSAGLLALRMDAQTRRLLLEQGPDDDLRAAGWAFDTVEALASYVHSLRAKGINVVQAAAEQAGLRGVAQLYSCSDPAGWEHEFYTGAKLADQPFISSRLKGPGFVAGALGVGHILTLTNNKTEALAFYRDVLGLLLSDTIREEIRPGLVVDATFLHAATGRHHSLAITALPSSKHLSHLMVEVQDMDDVGLAYDRCMRAGFPILMGLGRHPNDKCFSFYVSTPSGFSLEVGHGSIIVDDSTWQPGHYQQLSEWGHQRAQRATGS